MHRMHLAVFSACALFVTLLDKVNGQTTIVGLYNGSVEVPCNKGDVKSEDIVMTKWKYETNGEDNTGDLLTKSGSQNATFSPNPKYDGRISLTEKLGLRITQLKLADQTTFTCMLVTLQDILEKPVKVIVLKAPSAPKITNQAKVLEIAKLTTLGECSTLDANPAANVTWLKDNVLLADDGKVAAVTVTVKTDKLTGLSSTVSTLKYAAAKGDMNSKFACAVQHVNLSSDLVSAPMTFVIHYPAEQISLQILSADPMEGDDVTLKCKADGNPPPSSYSFYLKGKKVTVENSDTYTLAGVTRADSGEYKCSLVDNATVTDSVILNVKYLDIANVTQGKVVKRLSESFDATPVFSASGKTRIDWLKNNNPLNGQPKFDKLKYSDAGVYESVFSMGGLVKKASFELIIQGAPVITRMAKQRSDDGKVLSCEAEGSPKPTVHWSINGTNASESSPAEGKFIYKITIVPTANLTVNCTVWNDLGQASKNVDVLTISDDVTMDKREQSEDSYEQARVAVGVVVGLLLAALVIALIYWIYLKRTREGTWKTGEKENGTMEESKKLEETQSQKADV